jgi:hypothetical protein
MGQTDDAAAKALVARIQDLVAQVEQQRRALDQALEDAKALAERFAHNETITKTR